MDDSADVVQKVLAAAAEGNGEFELPLKPARVAAMRADRSVNTPSASKNESLRAQISACRWHSTASV